MTAPPEVQALATTVTNLVVTPQVNGVNITCNTSVTVRGQLQIGTASGTYTTFKGPIATQLRAQSHSFDGYGLAANTTYHYILQWYDGANNLLDATADATFTTLAPPAALPASQSMVNGPPAGGGSSVNILASAAITASATTTPGQDPNTFATHGTAGVTFVGGKLTVQQTGFYLIFASLQFAADISTGEASAVRLLLGGSQNVGTGLIFKYSTGSSGESTYVGNLTAGQTIEVQVVNGVATATTVTSGSIAVGGIG
jgi:hypothetical protein